MIRTTRVLISKKEKRFFAEMARIYPATLTPRDKQDFIQSHREKFKLRRTEDALMQQLRLAKREKKKTPVPPRYVKLISAV